MVSTQLVLSNMIKGPVMLGVIMEYSKSTLMVYLNGVDLDLRAQIQILYLDDLKSLGFGFRSNPSRILKAQIHGFKMTS